MNDMIDEIYENTSQGVRRKKKKIDDLDYFQCLCGVALRGNSLKTHWRLYCKLTREIPELLNQTLVPILQLEDK